jgi:hypothetical protein
VPATPERLRPLEIFGTKLVGRPEERREVGVGFRALPLGLLDAAGTEMAVGVRVPPDPEDPVLEAQAALDGVDLRAGHGDWIT